VKWQDGCDCLPRGGRSFLLPLNYNPVRVLNPDGVIFVSIFAKSVKIIFGNS